MTDIDPTRPQDPDDAAQRGHVLDGPDPDDVPRVEGDEGEEASDDDAELDEDDLAGDGSPA